MANWWGKSGSSDKFYFLGSKITLDDDCSHEIKRHLLCGRKTMTNLDSMWQSRDITLLTNVHLVKAMDFPVVMYVYESWTIKKAEHQRIDAFKLCCWKRPLKVPWIARGSNQSILKKINPEYSLEELMLKLQYFGHLMPRASSLEQTLILGRTEGRRRKGQQRMRWLVGITDLMDTSVSKLWEMMKDREAGRAAVHGITRGRTWLSHWTTNADNPDSRPMAQSSFSSSPFLISNFLLQERGIWDSLSVTYLCGQLQRTHNVLSALLTCAPMRITFPG